jgi:hypothetical protein
MGPPNDFQRARPRRGVRATLAGPALVSLGILAGCSSPDMMLRQFGILGTFAEDCSTSIEDGGARAVYEVPAAGYPTFTAINRFGTFRSKIVRADRINASTLIMYVDDPDGAWDEIDLRKVDNGFLTIRVVSHKLNEWRPLVAIDNGRLAGNTDRGLFIEKCSD